jgi:hypothetical protein
MMRRPLVFAIVLFAPVARAAPSQKCLDAYDNAQRLRREAKLVEAETALVTCAQAECPVELRRDCTSWLDEVRSSTPSIVVRAVDEAGCDLVEARILVDGQRIADRLDGKPFPLDPGVHDVGVERGEAKASQRIVLSTGEKNRNVTLGFAPQGTVCGAVKPRSNDTVVVPGPREPTEPRKPVPLLTWILGGVGIAGVAVGSGFYVSGYSQKSDLDACRPDCASGDVSSMRRTFAFGDAFFAAGIVSLGVATVVYLMR